MAVVVARLPALRQRPRIRISAETGCPGVAPDPVSLMGVPPAAGFGAVSAPELGGGGIWALAVPAASKAIAAATDQTRVLARIRSQA